MKKIYTFGTSYTAGGGFEWNSNDTIRNALLEECYSHYGIPKTQFDFSWPGFLKRLFLDRNNSVEVINYAKGGYGNERLYRKVYEVINDKNFDRENSLLILEFSSIMRKEFYYNKLRDYIICNYNFGFNVGTNEDYFGGVHLAHTYAYQSKETEDLLAQDQPLFFEFMSKTHNLLEVEKLIERNILFFISYLLQKKINFKIISWPAIKYDSLEGTGHKLEDYIIRLKYKDIDTDLIEFFIPSCDLTIRIETNDKYPDFHAGVKGNEIIASIVFNGIKNFIDSTLSPIKL